MNAATRLPAAHTNAKVTLLIGHGARIHQALVLIEYFSFFLCAAGVWLCRCEVEDSFHGVGEVEKREKGE